MSIKNVKNYCSLRIQNNENNTKIMVTEFNQDKTKENKP